MTMVVRPESIAPDPARHRAAAARHEQAAGRHDRAARFWAGRGDRARAGLQGEMASYERHGAVLERRWAELLDDAAGRDEVMAAEVALRRMRESGRQLAAALNQTADLFEQSAVLADQHAQRQPGGEDGGSRERRVAKRAREHAARARAQAAEWLDLGEGRRP